MKLKRQRLNAPTAVVPVIAPTGVYDRPTVAKILRRSKEKITELVRSGALAGRKEGNDYLILGEAILAYLRAPKPLEGVNQA